MAREFNTIRSSFCFQEKNCWTERTDPSYQTLQLYSFSFCKLQKVLRMLYRRCQKVDYSSQKMSKISCYFRGFALPSHVLSAQHCGKTICSPSLAFLKLFRSDVCTRGFCVQENDMWGSPLLKETLWLNTASKANNIREKEVKKKCNKNVVSSSSPCQNS